MEGNIHPDGRTYPAGTNINLRHGSRQYNSGCDHFGQETRLHGHEEEKKSETSDPGCDATNQLVKDGHENSNSHSQFQEYTEPLIRQPQHLTPPSKCSGSLDDEDDDDVTYYRVVYRGVVALLSQPDQTSPRSGCYLSYGEVVKSRFQTSLTAEKEVNEQSSPTGSNSHNPLAIRVDEILTGGYAFDPPDTSAGTGSVLTDTETPKRSNVQGYSTAVSPAAATSNGNGGPSTPSVTLAISHSSSSDEQLDLQKLESEALRCQHEGVRHHGFLLCRNKMNVPIVQALPRAPKCEHGRFFYKVISSTPLPIITGPSIDAPQTRAMALPGSIHEISFRMNIPESNNDNDDNGICFLRLARRKGYIADRRATPPGRRRPQKAASMGSDSLVRDVTDEYQNTAGVEHNTDDRIRSTPLYSNVSSFTVTKQANMRHRPPRRKKQDHLPPGSSASTNASRIRAHNNNDTNAANLSVQSHSSDRLVTPSSNVSVLSDDSSLTDQHQQQHTSFSSHDKSNSRINGALSPDRSVARSVKSNVSAQLKHSTYFLMRVTAPRGLKVLDAPHFQVNSLIHGTQQSNSASATQNGLASSGSTDVPALSGLNSTKNQHHLFHTMAGRITTTSGLTPADNAVIFDSVTKTRIFPRGAVFEASKRMETSEALFQGSGLIKLADDSGWVIIPHREELEQQYHSGGSTLAREGENGVGFEEIGSAIVYDGSNDMFSHNAGEDSSSTYSDLWMRVVARAGTHVVCAPPLPLMEAESASADSSPSSAAVSGTRGPALEHAGLGKSSSSEVASSVGSSFLDAMFRAPKRKDQVDIGKEKKGVAGAQAENTFVMSNTIPCGMCVQVESQLPSDKSHHQRKRNMPQEYARLRGGGWIPVSLAGKPTCVLCPRSNPPDSMFGSFWYRVQSTRGMKVRLGPSKRAPSIKSNDGAYFRFECGEFLRASEVLKVYDEDNYGRCRSESFAKLYRNRHVQLRGAEGDTEGDYRSLASLTIQAEWVQIHDGDEEYLKECSQEPRIERHKQGWRYTVVGSSGIKVLKGPSFYSESTGHIQEGENVVVIERVSNAEESSVTWLRLKDGGWLHNMDTKSGETLLVSTSFRHRTKAKNSRPEKPRHRPMEDKDQQVAYNTLIARLFHTDGHGPNNTTLK